MPPVDDIVRLVGGARRIAIATHVAPDPDAAGSSLGLALALQSLGKQVAVLCDDPLPREVGFLPGAELFGSSLPPGFSPDLLIALDSSDVERLGEAAAPLLDGALPVVNIDHHITNLRYGNVNLVEPDSASAAEMLVPLIDALGVPLSAEIAACLLAGVAGDTRSFSTTSVTPDTLRVAARLVESGADLAATVDAIFERRSFGLLRLWGLALSSLQIEDGIIWATVPEDERRRLDLFRVEAKGLSNLLLSAEEASIAAVFTELSDGQVEVSFRARPGYDVAEVALALGGGGHPMAAGCTVSGPLAEAVPRVLAALREHNSAALASGSDAALGSGA